jgi:hypothetical protein
MAKLASLPEASIISGFQGVIDYYVRDGVAICRKWPRRTNVIPTPLQQPQREIFATASRLWNTLTPDIRAAYETMASASTLSARDMMIKMYINANSIYSKVGNDAFS